MMVSDSHKKPSLRAQFIFLMLSRGLGSGFQAILVIAFARMAGTEGMGLVAITTGALSMVLSVAEFGMSPLLSKARALKNAELVATIVVFNFWSSITFGVLGLGAAYYYLDHSGLPVIVAYLAISIALEKNTDVSLNIPIADGRKWFPALSIIFRRLCNLGVFCLLILTGSNPLGAYVICLVVGSLCGQIHVQLYLRRNVESSDRISFRQMIAEAVPYSVSNISGQTRILDSVIVGLVTSVGTAGLYSAAMRLTNPLSLVASSLTSVVMPYAARNDHAYSVALGQRLVYLAGGSFVLILPLAIYSEQVVTFLLGQDFSGAAGAFLGGIIALPFLSLASPLGSILQSRGRQKYVALNGAIFAIITLVSVAIGAMFWGASGASFGLAISFALKFSSLWVRLISLNGSPVPARITDAT